MTTERRRPVRQELLMRHPMTKVTILFATALFMLAVAAPVAFAQDADCDGIPDVTDNCPDKFNPDQADLDNDGLGNRCDPDKDGDLVANDVDNCPRVSNDAQTDSDGDGVGDACDECAADGDDAAVNGKGCTIDQLCPCDGPDEDQAWRSHGNYLRCVKRHARNFQRKELITRDDRSEVVTTARASSCGDATPAPGDNDGDGIPDASDNCPSTSNPSQRNTDGDAFGNACDSDKDDDGVLNEDDNCPVVANAAGQADDGDADSVGDACDVCPDTEAGAIVSREGCSISQACPCDLDADGNPWRSRGAYVRCVVDEAFAFRLRHLINKDEAAAFRDAAKSSTCGRRDPSCG
jgi:Thrombospondin type 3 repeat